MLSPGADGRSLADCTRFAFAMDLLEFDDEEVNGDEHV
jgi:hypothetical protein